MHGHRYCLSLPPSVCLSVCVSSWFTSVSCCIDRCPWPTRPEPRRPGEVCAPVPGIFDNSIRISSTWTLASRRRGATKPACRDPSNYCMMRFRKKRSLSVCIPYHRLVWLGSLVVGVSDPMTAGSWVRSITTALSSNNLGQVVHIPQPIGAMPKFGGPAD